ncbi:MAG: (2Fe-2S)-binding protein [Deltaproteobacteria bacterium]|nr:(2Fe-2S)-binding protein [Deltaproteobacteria bacterium]
MLLRFEPSGVEVHAHAGERVVDVCDAHPDAGVPFSCRAANCATCRVTVVEGSANLASPRADELEVLAVFDEDPAKVRLACQLVLAPDPAPLGPTVSPHGEREAGLERRVVLRVVEH